MFWCMFYDWWLNTCCYDSGVGQTEVTNDMMETCSMVEGHYVRYFGTFSADDLLEIK